MTVLNDALAMAAQGFHVFPLRKPDDKEPKRPLDGFMFSLYASTDPDQIVGWFGPGGKYTAHNYGVRTGEGVAVFDADVKHENGLASLDLARSLDLDPFLVVATPSGGRHAYVRLPDGVVVDNSHQDTSLLSKAFPGIDVRGTNGYVVGPGSTMADGRRYEIIEQVAGTEPLAQYFLDLCRANPASAPKPKLPPACEPDLDHNLARVVDYLKHAEPAIQGANGDNRTIATANRCMDLGASIQATAEVMIEHWNDNCSPPWDPYELEGKVASAGKSRDNPIGCRAAEAEFDAVEINETEPKPALPLVDASTLTGDPPPRLWILPNAIPKYEVTLLYGDGGLGKSLLAQQLGTAIASGTPFLDMPMQQGRVLAIFCEDDTHELHRRQKAMGATLPPNAFLWASADELAKTGGILMTFADGQEGKLTLLFKRIEEVVAAFQPDLIIFDPLANMFGGKEADRGQVTQFVNRAMKSLCVKYKATVLGLAHPSLSGMETGRGTSGSTGWNNAVRSRLYLSKPKNDPTGDYRTLETMKSNYGKPGRIATLRWRDGIFVPATGPEDQPDRLAERTLLAAIKVLTDRGTLLSAVDTARNYAVRLAMRLDEVSGLPKDALDKALERLLRAGTLSVQTVRDASYKQREVLVLNADVDSFDAALDDI